MRPRDDENTLWTYSQDYGADEILYIARTALFNKTNQLIREIMILFEVYPQLFTGVLQQKNQKEPYMANKNTNPGGGKTAVPADINNAQPAYFPKTHHTWEAATSPLPATPTRNLTKRQNQAIRKNSTIP